MNNQFPPVPGGVGPPPPPSGNNKPEKKDGYSTQSRVISISKGKIPPQAIDLEQVILGAMMIDTKGLEIMPIMFVEMFYKEAHMWIYEAIEQLWEAGQPVDLLTVSDRLKRNKTIESAGGEYYLVQLTQMVSSSAHVEFHARIVMQMYVLRRIISLGNHQIEMAYDSNPDIFEIMEYIQADHMDIYEKITQNNQMQSQSLAEQAKEKREKALKGELSYLPGGLARMDRRMNGGFTGSEITILAGRPGMGKTSVAIILAKSFSFKHNFKGVLFSLEMPKRQVVNKIASMHIPLTYAQLQRLDQLSHEDFNRAVNYYDWFESDECNLKVEDQITTIPGIARYIEENRPQYVIVDYLQLLELDSKVSKKAGNREQEVSYFSRNLKLLAKKYDIPIIPLSQLSRKAEDRPNQRPRLSDLRESGSLEQDADNVIFIVRPAYYKDKEHVPEIEQGNLIIDLAKGRNIGIEVFYAWIDLIGLEWEENHKMGGIDSLPPAPPNTSFSDQ